MSARITKALRHETVLGLYAQFHDPKYLDWDPLSVVRSFKGSSDQEYVALISALFAFGGVKQIIASVRNAVGRLGLAPEAGPGSTSGSGDRHVRTLSEIDLEERLSGFRHRIYVDRDLASLTRLYQKTLEVHGSLQAHFLIHHDPAAETVAEGLTGLIRDWKEWTTQLELQTGAHFQHMLNSPADGSTCKRWLMLLKWLVRADDGIDLGLWSGKEELRPDQLLIPLDTHLFKITRKLGFTKKKTPNFQAAIEVTRKLKEIDPGDPTRFDFSLCRYGMFDYRKRSTTKRSTAPLNRGSSKPSRVMSPRFMRSSPER
jgi:uncharacterized protein (TIGR02757 family)